MSHEVLSLLYYALGITALLSGAFFVVRQKRTQIEASAAILTEQTYKELATAQSKKISFLEDEIKKIPSLQRQIDDLKTIPLKEIAESFKSVTDSQTQLVKNQKQIILLIKGAMS